MSTSKKELKAEIKKLEEKIRILEHRSLYRCKIIYTDDEIAHIKHYKLFPAFYEQRPLEDIIKILTNYLGVEIIKPSSKLPKIEVVKIKNK